MNKTLGAIVLAAGKGARMGSKTINKVALPLFDKPMIVHTVELLEKLGIKKIVVVVGFAKNSVTNILGQKVFFAVQRKRLGTAHALECGLKIIPKDTQNLLVLNGDDSAFYTAKVIHKLIEKHFIANASLTFLTIKKDSPQGLGRVVKNKQGKVIAIVEEKDATISQKKIKEINPGCYVFKTRFLEKYLSKVEKSPITGEYYLTSLIDIGIGNGKKVETLSVGQIPWRGVNTRNELEEAQKLFLQIK